MAPVAQDVVSSREMADAFFGIYHEVFGFTKPMALKCAVDLGIPDAMERCGGASTITDIASETGVHPAKIPDLRRLMKLLSTSGMFGITAVDGGDAEPLYTLTAASRLLAGSCSMSPMVRFLLNPVSVSPFFNMQAWLRSEPNAAKSLFELSHGCSRWEMVNKDNNALNHAMLADSEVLMDAVVRDHADIFSELSSLVDVGGGHGAAAKAIARAFPHVKCTVMDLAHMVGEAPATDSNPAFVAGNMFESIPQADAVLLKYILHCFGHDECVKILRNCKASIPAGNAGGKVLIIDIVIGSGPRDMNIAETEAMINTFMMCIGGVEREEQEWKIMFDDAGFSDYKIKPALGPLSVIELYP